MAPRAGRTLVAGDAAILEGAAKLFALTYGDMDAFGNYIEKINSRLNANPNDDPQKAGLVMPGDEKRLSPEGDKLLKDFAQDYVNKIDNYISTELDNKPSSRAIDFHKEVLRQYKHDLSNVAKGISAVQDSELANLGRRAATDYLPQMNRDVFKPDRIEQTARALEQFPLDRYLKIANDLQEMQEDLALNRENLSKEVIAERDEAIRGKKHELLEVAKDLYEKSKEPAEDTISLFDGKECLNGPNGFMNQRGLKTLISDLEQEEAQLDWDKKGIPKEMGSFSTRIANAVDIYGPNPKHHEAWETSKKVYDKTDFERDLKNYDASGLPFTETELSMIGMAYTGLETEKNIEARNKCPNHIGTDRENLEGNTFWTSDLMDSEEGPRANLVSYGPMLQAGREGAKSVAEAYAAGDKKPLAEVIQNNFRIQQKSTLKEAGIGTTSAGLTYLSQKTFLDMLDRDPELMQEFVKANEAVPAGDKVNLDNVKAQCAVSKIALDKINANHELKQNPMLPVEQKKELQKKILTADILANMAEVEKSKQSNHPDYIRKKNEMDRQVKELMKDPSRAGEYTALMNRFLDETNKQSEILPYLNTEAGKKRLDAFVDRMTDTFGPTLLSSSENNKAQYERSQAEMQKFTLDLLKETNLAKLSSGQELTAEEKKQIVSDYIRQDVASEGYDRFFKTGEKNRYLEMLGGNATENEKNGILPYDDKLKGFIDNMGLENMRPEEISEMLTIGAYREMTDKIAQSAELEHERSMKRTGPSLDSALEDLKEGKRNAWFGKADYNNVLSDLDKMNAFYQEHGKEILEKGTEAIDPELAKKQEELLKNMDAYLARKEREFAENKERGKKDNAHSRERFDAMTKAKKALQERMEYDKRINGLVGADKEYQEYAKEVAESRKGEPAQQVEQQAEQVAQQPAPEKSSDKKLAAQMKKFDKEIQRFHDMSKLMFHEPDVDAGALGLNSWELQVAKVVAIAGVKTGLEKGDIKPEDIDREMTKNVRKIARSQEFQTWVKDVSDDSKKVEQLGKMSPEEVRMEFVKGMSKGMSKDTSKEMNKESDAPQRNEKQKIGVNRYRSKSVNNPVEPTLKTGP